MKALTLKILILFVGFGLYSSVYAQQPRGKCGLTDHTTINQRLIENRALRSERVSPRSGAVEYFPVNYILTAESDGTDRIRYRHILEMHCQWNEEYADQEYQFYIKDTEFTEANNSTVHNSPRTTFGSLQMGAFKDGDAINIFVAKNADDGNSANGVTLGYYDPQAGRDWIVIRKAEFIGLTSTISHEVGHYFNLDHPHNGWDAVAYDHNIHGPCAPSVSPGGVPTERMNGSNCMTAGDFLCDTPPDYQLGFGWQGCNYTGPAQDPDCTPVDPDENLFMGYFLDGCTPYYFSNDQKDIITDALASPMRAPLHTGWTPASTTIGNLVLEPPFSHSNTGNTDVDFDWNEVPGATHYVFEIARNFGFTAQFQNFITTNTEFTIPNLLTNSAYYWRVFPYNAYATCHPGEIMQFTAGVNTTSIGELEAISYWEVNPNPVTTGADINLLINTVDDINSTINILNASGILVQSFSKKIARGHNSFNLSLDNIPAGLYLVQVESKEGFVTKKLVIQ